MQEKGGGVYEDDQHCAADAQDQPPVSRRELYDLVWMNPVTAIARRFGLSDRGLGKLCKRHNIPVPPRGYWARIRQGQTMRRPPLPDHPELDGIAIRSGGEQYDEPIPSESPEIEFERRPENRVVARTTAGFTHPLVVKTSKALANSAVDQRGIHFPPPHALSVRVSEAARPRALRTMDALIAALEARGHKVSVVSEKRELHGYYPDPRIEITSKTLVTILGETIEFGIEERATQVAKGKGIDLRGKKVVSPRSFQHDYVPSGHLSLEIRTWSGGMKRTWTEAERRPDLPLNDFIEGLVRTALWMRDERIEAERRRQAELDAEQRREEEREHRVAEANRVDLAHRQLRALDESRRVSRLVRLIRRQATRQEMSPSADSELGRWLAWLEDYARRIDPLSNLLNGAKVHEVGIGHPNQGPAAALTPMGDGPFGRRKQEAATAASCT